MIKKKFTTNELIYLVGSVENGHVISIIAAFKDINQAQNFIKECKQLVADSYASEAKVGHWTVTNSNVEYLEILNSHVTATKDFPFFNK